MNNGRENIRHQHHQEDPCSTFDEKKCFVRSNRVKSPIRSNKQAMSIVSQALSSQSTHPNQPFRCPSKSPGAAARSISPSSRPQPIASSSTSQPSKSPSEKCLGGVSAANGNRSPVGVMLDVSSMNNGSLRKADSPSRAHSSKNER